MENNSPTFIVPLILAVILILYIMIIKGHDGDSHNVTGQGQGNYNTVGKIARCSL